MKKEYLLVDGYNIIFAWGELKAIADSSLEEARIRLIDILCDYQGYTQVEIIVVFDAHMVKGARSVIEDYVNIKVVYTKEAETADNFIERAANKLAKDYRVRVATSDNMEQIIILGRGAYRMSARELWIEVTTAKDRMRKEIIAKRPVKENPLLDRLDPRTARLLEEMRRKRD